MDALAYIAEKYHLNYRTKELPIIVPGLSRIRLAGLFAELGFMTGAEIGVQNGKYSWHLLHANPDLTLYSIDPWCEYAELPIRGALDDPQIQAGQDQGYENTCARLAEFKHSHVIRAMSMDAVKTFPDRSLDFVYVDGNHEFIHATQDIFYWLPKIKIGGILAGHDYRRYYPSSFSHAFHVANAFTAAYGIKPWFTTDYCDGETVRSFFWVVTDFGYRRP